MKWYIGRLKPSCQRAIEEYFGRECIVYVRKGEDGRTQILAKREGDEWKGATLGAETAKANVAIERDSFSGEAMTLRTEGDNGRPETFPSQAEASEAWEALQR